MAEKQRAHNDHMKALDKAKREREEKEKLDKARKEYHEGLQAQRKVQAKREEQEK